MFWVGGTLGGNRFIAPGIMVSGFWFLLRKRGWRRAALPRTFVAHGREACDAVESARLPRSRAETPWQPTWLPRASDADRRGRCLSCPSPERLSCERQALCECFEYLSRINRVFGSTLLETERSSITTSAERPMRAAILRAPPGAGKASSHATTRADPCRELPAPDVDNLSLTLITSRDQSEQKPETRTQNAHAAFLLFPLEKIGWGYTCSLAGMSSLGRSGRYIHTAETRPTADPTGNRGGCPRKQIPEKTERAAETDRPLGFRLWETAMGNRSRNPMGNRGLVSALCTNVLSALPFSTESLRRLRW